jgi:hypothetical protein
LHPGASQLALLATSAFIGHDLQHLRHACLREQCRTASEKNEAIRAGTFRLISTFTVSSVESQSALCS